MSNTATNAGIGALIDANTAAAHAFIDQNATDLKTKVAALTFNPDPTPPPPTVKPPVISYPPQALMAGTPIKNITPTNSGDAATYSGTLPAGLSLDPATGVISGTPVSSNNGPVNYQIVALNAGGSYSFQLSLLISNAIVVVPTLPGMTAIGGIKSSPVTLQSNFNYNGLTIDMAGGFIQGMTGSGVSNVNITNCKFINTTAYGIVLSNCKNVNITGCFFDNVAFGVNVLGGSTINVSNNQFLNINGNNAKNIYGHAVQFNQVNGSGNRVNGNRIENINGVAQNPHDILNIFNSNGVSGDNIQVNGNLIRGGQYASLGLGGAAGIVLGDLGGSYQEAKNNILVNPGFCGMDAAGGTHILMDNNQIFSGQTPVSVAGLFYANYSKLPSSDVTFSNNQVAWTTHDGKSLPYNNNGNSVNGVNVILINNIFGAKIDASILPQTLITFQ